MSAYNPHASLDEGNVHYQRLCEAVGFETSASFDELLRRCRELQKYATTAANLSDAESQDEENPQSLSLAGVNYVVVSETHWERLIKKLAGPIP